jgi:hypothetical protein
LRLIRIRAGGVPDRMVIAGGFGRLRSDAEL